MENIQLENIEDRHRLPQKRTKCLIQEGWGSTWELIFHPKSLKEIIHITQSKRLCLARSVCKNVSITSKPQNKVNHNFVNDSMYFVYGKWEPQTLFSSYTLIFVYGRQIE